MNEQLDKNAPSTELWGRCIDDMKPSLESRGFDVSNKGPGQGRLIWKRDDLRWAHLDFAVYADGVYEVWSGSWGPPPPDSPHTEYAVQVVIAIAMRLEEMKVQGAGLL